MLYGCLRHQTTLSLATAGTAYPSMVKHQITLRDLLERFRADSGVGRVMVLASIRDYISRRSLRSLLDEISAVSSKDDLNVLLGVGLRGDLQTYVTAQKAKFIEY
jgi:hypothetical protein